MSVVLRLTRGGAKKRPFYHIVAADRRAPRDGRFIERLGTYNPMLPSDHADRVTLKEERLRYWLGHGAQPTERVAKFLGKAGIIEMPKISERPKKSAPKAKAQERLEAERQKAADAAEAAAEAEAETEAPAEAEADAGDAGGETEGGDAS